MGRIHVSPLPLDMTAERLRVLAGEYGVVKAVKMFEGYGAYVGCEQAGCREV